MRISEKKRVLLIATGVLSIVGSSYLALRLSSPGQPISSSATSPNPTASTADGKVEQLPSKLFPHEHIQVHTLQKMKQRGKIEGGRGDDSLPNTEPVEILKRR
jgi:hypothetical protein